MERHSIDDEQAFNMIREHSAAHRKVVEVSEAILASHRLLANRRPEDGAGVAVPGSYGEPCLGRDGEESEAPGAM